MGEGHPLQRELDWQVHVCEDPLSPAPHTLVLQETLVWLLKSLPIGCYFNIYGFGSSYEAFFQ